MNIKKGKPYFTIKDTWSLDTELAKFICAGVKKFKEVINEGGGYRKGIPQSITKSMEELKLISYEGEYGNLSDDEYEMCAKYFDWVLDEVIYSFDDSNEPDIEDYDFNLSMERDSTTESGCIPVTIKCTNEDEKQRYQDDTDKYHKRCEEGRLLFAKHFNGLWW